MKALINKETSWLVVKGISRKENGENERLKGEMNERLNT